MMLGVELRSWCLRHTPYDVVKLYAKGDRPQLELLVSTPSFLRKQQL